MKMERGTCDEVHDSATEGDRPVHAKLERCILIIGRNRVGGPLKAGIFEPDSVHRTRRNSGHAISREVIQKLGLEQTLHQRGAQTPIVDIPAPKTLASDREKLLLHQTIRWLVLWATRTAT
jgi:hypothetical protein